MARYPLAALVAAVLLAAGRPADAPSPEELVRRGNEAFLRGDLDAAEEAYRSAQERTADPGLVAFNKAAVLMQKGEYREAELHYLRTLDDRDAPPDRRAKALYNRGVCLLHRGGEAAVYRTAIGCFEQSLDLTPADDPLAADARHNLELAKLLWARSRAKEKAPPRANDAPPEPESPQPPPPGPEDGSDPGGSPEGPGGAGGKVDPLIGRAVGGRRPRETSQKAPGAGTLPVLADADRVQPLTPEDTRAYLKRIDDRLQKDRKANARLMAGPERTNVPDW